MRTGTGGIQSSFWVDEEITEISYLAERLLGKAGRILYITKSMRAPTVILNANVFNANAKRIWFGDIEIEKDGKALIKLSGSLGALYILYEAEGRFLEQPPSPLLIKDIAVVAVEGEDILYSRDFAERVGILKKRLRYG
jgi:hypothetical protein